MTTPDRRKAPAESENRRAGRRPKERSVFDRDPETLEGPADRQDAGGKSDTRNEVTRRGER